MPESDYVDWFVSVVLCISTNKLFGILKNEKLVLIQFFFSFFFKESRCASLIAIPASRIATACTLEASVAAAGYRSRIKP